MLKKTTHFFLVATLAFGAIVGGFFMNIRDYERVHATYVHTITDDATGGDCTSIGTWDDYLNVCTMTSTMLINNTQEDGIEIAMSDVTLDCNGYGITSILPSNNTGIYATGRSNVVIKNCTLLAFDYSGIYLVGGSNNAIIGNNPVVDSGAYGIWLDGTDDSYVINNVVEGGYMGIYNFGQADNNEYYGNEVISSSTTIAFGIDGGDGNKIVGNAFSNATDDGIWTGSGPPDTTNTVIRGNTITGNVTGIHWNSTGSGNVISGNIITGNSTKDIDISGGTPTGLSNTCDGTTNGWTDTDDGGGSNGCVWETYPTAQPGCGSVGITTNVMLTADVGDGTTGCTGNGINLGASNIVLDCAGYTIHNFGTATNSGVYNTSGYDYVVIKNCEIGDSLDANGFYYGYNRSGSTDDSHLINNTVNDARYYGLYNVGYQRAVAVGNTMTGNGSSGYGFRTNSYNSKFLANDVSDFGSAINMSGVSYADVKYNNFSSNGNGILSTSNFNNSFITHNTIDSNTANGIQFNSSSDDNNTIEWNAITNNATGIYFSNSGVGGNVVNTNYIIGNSSWDIRDVALNSGDNNACNDVHTTDYWRDTGEQWGCTYTTVAGTCGDGDIDGAEMCDDSDSDGGDGCSASCVPEVGYSCSGEPSTCTAITECHIDNCSSLYGWWALDEINTLYDVADSSGQLHTGSNIGPVATSSTAKFNKSYYFDGTNDYVLMGEYDGLDVGTGDFTVTAWVQPGSIGTSQAIYDKRNTGGYLLGLHSGGTIHAYVSDGTDNIEPASTATLTNGEWTHVAAVFDRSGNATIYIDGNANGTPVSMSLIDSVDNTGSAILGDHSPEIGSIWGKFYGYIDEAMLWKRTLSAAEILKMYNLGVLPIDPATSAFDTAYGTTDFIAVPNMSAIDDMKLAVSNNEFIEWGSTAGWGDPVDARDDDYETNVTYGSGWFNVQEGSLDTSIDNTADVSVSVSSCDDWTIYHATGTTITSLTQLKTSGLEIGSGAGASGTCTNATYCETSPAPACSGDVVTYRVKGFSGTGAEGSSCGDNVIEGVEQCDDGGTGAGDGCSATCTIESGYTCANQPSNCVLSATGLPFVITDDNTGGDCETIGTWDEDTRICTLTTPINSNSPNGSDLFEITDDYITLDCNDKSLSATGTIGASEGVVVLGTHATVKDCYINDFDRQIKLETGADYGAIVRNTLSGGATGIRVETNYSYIINNNVTGASSYGIHLIGAGYNEVYGNVVDSVSQGIRLWKASNNKVIGNTSSNNSSFGLRLGDDAVTASSSNEIRGNTIEDNASANGIYITGIGTTNTIDSNIVLGNATQDINMSGAQATGDNNTCLLDTNWDDSGTTGCTWSSLPTATPCTSSFNQNTKLTSDWTCSWGPQMSGHTLMDCDNNTLYITYDALRYNGNNIIFKNCNVVGAGQYGMRSSVGTGWAINNSVVSGDRDSINFNSLNMTIVGNTLTDNTDGPSSYAAINLTGGGAVNYNILYNVIDGNSTGIKTASGASGHTIIGNEISNSDYTAINLYVSNGNTVKRNIINSSGTDGIYMYSSDSNIVESNIITGSGGYGITMNSSSNSNVIGDTAGGTTVGKGNYVVGNTTDIRDYDSNTGDQNTCDVPNSWDDDGVTGCTYGTLPVCGDGEVNGTDQCDDGGTSAGDGCSATCTIESGYNCAGEPSSCQENADSEFSTEAGIANSAIAFVGNASDGGSSATSVTIIGNNVTFTATGDDANEDDYWLLACNTTGFTHNGTSAPTCTGTQWAVSNGNDVADGADPATAAYTTTGNEACFPTCGWNAYVCDKITGGSCAGPNTGTGDNGSPFVMNQGPVIGTVTIGPSYGSSASVDPGNGGTGAVYFQVAVTDPNAGDTIDMHVCSTNSFTGGTCDGVTYCSVTGVSSGGNAQCVDSNLVPIPSAHTSRTAYIFAVDNYGAEDNNTNNTHSYSVTDTPPYVSNDVDYSVTDITLTAGGYQEKTYTVTIKDDNGDTDLVDDTTGYLYDLNSVASLPLNSGHCTPADTNCYDDSYCSLSANTSGADNTATATCAFTCSPGSAPACTGGNPLWFNANYSANWRLHVNPKDGQGEVTDQTDSTAIDVEALQALNITQASIGYGSIVLGGTSSGKTVTVENMGNQLLDFTAEGDAMCIDSYVASCPGNSIPVVQQKWHHNSATFNWSDSEAGAGPYILEDDATQGAQSCTFGVDCDDTNGCLNRNLTVATGHLSPPSESFYWKILIPSSQAPGGYYGLNTVSAVASDSCMGTLY